MAEHKLYGGDVTISFDARKHVYTWKEERTRDGSPLMIAGVTSILNRLAKEALIPWASGMASDYFKNSLLEGFDETNPEETITVTVAEVNEIAKDARKAYAKKTKGAADIGKMVHAYAEAFLKGDKEPAPPKKILNPEERLQYDNGVRAFKAWWRNNEVIVMQSERVLFSKRWLFAGTTDLTARINGRRSVADFKTSSGLYPSMAIQTAAYQIALEEEEGDVYQDRVLIHLDKFTGQYGMKILPRSRRDEEAFLRLREADELIKQIEKSW
jgi:hypothetical protein